MTVDLGVDGGAPAPFALSPRKSSFASVVAGLTGVNAVILVAGLVTGPLTARFLGAGGRGELAAIIVTLTMGPWLLDLGLSQWLARERALRRPRCELLGAALPVALACSLVGALAAVPVSHAIGAGRSTVIILVQVGLFLMPVSVLLQTLTGLAIGESRWRLYSASRIVGSMLPMAVIVVLATVGHLTVVGAAVASLAGGLVAGLMFLGMVRGTGRLIFDWSRSWSATRFGAKTWLTTVSGTANNRLDQVLMAGLVPSRQLGLYAVAVTLASIAGTFAVGAGGALFPRVAAGNADLAGRSCRVTICAVTLTSVPLAAICPIMIPLIFGADFGAAAPMAVLLLIASVPMAAATVLGSVLTAANHPGAAMRAELVALAFTVPALILVLPSSGGTGAAIVSLVAYTARATMQVKSAAKAFTMPWLTFVVATRADLGWLVRQAQHMLLRRERAQPTAHEQ